MSDDLRDRMADAMEDLWQRGYNGWEDLDDAVLPVVEAETEKLRRQVMGYRGMKDVYLCERNEAYRGLIEAERIIERLCDDREAGQGLAKAALTEQRERAEEAERQRDEALAAIERVRRIAQVWVDIEPQHPTLTNEGHVTAYAGEQTLAALDLPEGT